ncbi:MAG TPA: class I SAM-dependent methyltransferase [Acidimicrobiales bacterium]|nr:class I SAM-dependent methyltransferase [Acidimicrobiales bacterium]
MPDLELLDCGDGRRLERFGAVVVDRPAPGAVGPRGLPDADWARPALRWAKGAWVRGAAVDPWPVRAAGLVLECRPAAGGQVGVFAEHAATWGWLDAAVRSTAGALGRPPEVLSLFAYTGGATLACVRAGAHVAHVDASRPAVAWARRNAELSGLGEAPVRWLVDDARAFVRRERRRGRRYDGVVLDPPSYGHGTGAWQIEEHLPALLDDLAALCGPRPGFVVFSAHTPGYDGEALAGLLREHLGVAATGSPLALDARSGKRLELGAWARGGHLAPVEARAAGQPPRGPRR